MEKRLLLFFVLAVVILMANNFLISWLYPRKPLPKPPRQVAAQAEPGEREAQAGATKKPPETAAAENEPPTQPAPPEEPGAAATAAEEEKGPSAPEERVTLGSADEQSPFRQLVTLVNRGAAVERLELNSSHHTDQEDDSGYIGHLAARDAEDQPGAVIGVVGTGTPAAAAGLTSGDIITTVDQAPISSAEALERAIDKTKPHQTISIKYQRKAETRTAQVKLARRPMEVIRPTNMPQLLKYWEQIGPDVVQPLPSNVPSFRLALDAVGEQKPAEGEEELPGGQLENETWEIDRESKTDSVVEFHKRLDRHGLEIIKRYELAKVEAKQSTAPAYHLDLTVEIRNTRDMAQEVAYRLYGPNGLPTEGWWYASKISRNWGGAGPRDVVVGAYEGGRISPSLISTSAIVGTAEPEPRRGTPLTYIGVDAQYFSCVMIPRKKEPQQDWFYQWQPLVIGAPPTQKDKLRLANVSFRVTSDPLEVPAGGSVSQTYTVFAGPKQPELVDHYGLGNLIYYGWFGWVSRPMAKLLHAFYFVVRNYGLAVILLTVLVRSAMMPLSRKQVQSAQKMQELQPELKKLQEKYKNDMEARSKAQRELFLKHNYNPLGGCLLMFVQLPIFIGLYRALSADLELRGAPLLWEGAWCSNLAAPDKLFRWDAMLPGYFVGWLGPYLNLLPIITIVLFIWQQKMFMPPATDEQTRLQQRMMQYMMVFIGVMFFKVPSGLCIYFIASSLWGLAERKLMPKPGAKSAQPPGPTTEAAVPRISPKPGGNGSRKLPDRGKKQREKR